MKKRTFTTAFEVDQSPEDVFLAINHVRDWWSGEVDGETEGLGSVFTYRVPGIHFSRQQIIEFIPGQKVVWHVTDAELAFVKDVEEWKGTDIVFEIQKKGVKTEVRFSHVGLVPELECFNDCSNAWEMLITGNLRRRIATGEPQPSPWD